MTILDNTVYWFLCY